MTKLYELAKELAVINDQLFTEQGEITPELEARLDAINLALEQKAMGIRKWTAMIDGDALALDAEIKRLQRMQTTNENLKDRLKEYIKNCMETAQLKSIKTLAGTFTITPNQPSVEIVVEDMVPDNFKIPQPAKIDKTAIKTALQNGYEVPGTKLITDKTHLRIR